jgi:hypothetical protein
MPIFARRSLQRLLDENSEFLSPVQTKKLVERLNRMDKDLTLSPEWEVALLNALSKAGKVIYEKDFGGTNRADIYFESRDNPDHRFVAEITAVSDRGLDQLNPFDALSQEFNNIIRNRGLHPSRFLLKVGAHGEPHYKGGPKVRLKLTGRARFNEKIFGPDFYRFVGNIAREPESPNRFLVQTDEVDLEIGYDPARKYGEGVYLDYTVVYSLTNNVIYNALSEKASQLDGTNFHGPRGIILCDGSCMFLSQPPIRDLSYTCDEVIWHFLNENSSINFVLTCVVKDVGDPSSPYLGPFRLSLHLYKGLEYDDISLDLWGFVQKLEFPAPNSTHGTQ